MLTEKMIKRNPNKNNVSYSRYPGSQLTDVWKSSVCCGLTFDMEQKWINECPNQKCFTDSKEKNNPE